MLLVVLDALSREKATAWLLTDICARVTNGRSEPRLAKITCVRIGRKLKRQAHRELNYARATAAEAWISLGYVGSGADYAIWRDARCDEVIWEREIRVVEDVEEFGAELGP